MANTSYLKKLIAVTMTVLVCVGVTSSQSLTCFVKPAVLDLRSSKDIELVAVGDGGNVPTPASITYSSRDKPEIYSDGNIVAYGENMGPTQNVILSDPEKEYLRGARFGVHFCDLFHPTSLFRATLLIHNQNTLIPKDAIRSYIVSVGDTLRLCVNPNIPKTWKGPIEWVFNGKQTSWLKRWTGSTCIRIKHVETCQAGVYEAYRRICGRHTNQHAFFEVKVRECPAGFHGPPACASSCVSTCQNGYCSALNGDCLCWHGFTGSNCDTAEGLHPDIASTLGATAEGVLMCTEHAGCTCAPGWSGIKCDQACDEFWYGPDCALACSGGTECNRFTGVQP
ncbi:uncharacterized protein [Apostichopus japonicus]|uniref:uncharacterized protein n=1 Tax=Stichopus japonicus TaxID=307972 RepID=UPI003AB7AE0E